MTYTNLCGISSAGAGGAGGGTGPVIYWTRSQFNEGLGTAALFYDDEKPPKEGGVEQIFRLPPSSTTTTALTNQTRQPLPVVFDGKIHVGAYQALSATEPAYLAIFNAIAPRGDIRYPLERSIVIPVSGGTSAASRYTEIRGMANWRSRLYFSSTTYADTNTETVVLWSWDGVAATIVESETFGTNVFRGYSIWPYKDAMIEAQSVGTGANPNTIRRVTVAGVGSNLTLPATLFSPAPIQPMAEYKGRLYILGGDFTGGNFRVVLYEYISGTSATLLRAIDTSVSGTHSTTSALGGLFVFNGFLYYTWYNGTNYFLGRWDGTTFSDSHATLTADAPWTLTNTPNAMVNYKNSLCLLLTQVPGFLRSNGTTTTSFTHIGKTLDPGGAFGGTACTNSAHGLVV